MEQELSRLQARAPNWTLADDSALCTTLEQLSAAINLRCEVLDARLKSIQKKTGQFDAAIQEINVDLSILANTKFIELKIDEDDTPIRHAQKPVRVKTTEEVHSEIVGAVAYAVSAGLGLVASQFTQVTRGGTETEDAVVQWEPKADIEPNLPELIGSESFLKQEPLFKHAVVETPVSPPISIASSSAISPSPSIPPPPPPPPFSATPSPIHLPAPRETIDKKQISPPIAQVIREQSKEVLKPKAKSSLFDDDSSDEEEFFNKSGPSMMPISREDTASTLSKRSTESKPSGESDLHSLSGSITPPLVTGNKNPLAPQNVPSAADIMNAAANLRKRSALNEVPTKPPMQKPPTSIKPVAAENCTYVAQVSPPVVQQPEPSNQKPTVQKKPEPVAEVIPPRVEHVPQVRQPERKISAQINAKKSIGKSLFDSDSDEEDLFKPLQKPVLPKVASTAVPAKQSQVPSTSAAVPAPVAKKTEPPAIANGPKAVNGSAHAPVQPVTKKAAKYKSLFDSDSDGEDLFRSISSGAKDSRRNADTNTPGTTAAPAQNKTPAVPSTSAPVKIVEEQKKVSPSPRLDKPVPEVTKVEAPPPAPVNDANISVNPELSKTASKQHIENTEEVAKQLPKVEKEKSLKQQTEVQGKIDVPLLLTHNAEFDPLTALVTETVAANSTKKAAEVVPPKPTPALIIVSAVEPPTTVQSPKVLPVVVLGKTPVKQADSDISEHEQPPPFVTPESSSKSTSREVSPLTDISDSNEMPGKLSNSAFASMLNNKLAMGPPPIGGPRPAKTTDDAPVDGPSALPGTTQAATMPRMGFPRRIEQESSAKLFDDKPDLLPSMTKDRARPPPRRPKTKRVAENTSTNEDVDVAVEPVMEKLARMSTEDKTEPASQSAVQQTNGSTSNTHADSDRSLQADKIVKADDDETTKPVDVQPVSVLEVKVVQEAEANVPCAKMKVETLNATAEAPKQTISSVPSNPLSNESKPTKEEPKPKKKGLFESDSDEEEYVAPPPKTTVKIEFKTVEVKEEKVAPKPVASASSRLAKPVRKSLFDDSDDDDLNLFRKK